MTIVEWLRLILGCICLLLGLMIFVIELYGVYRLKYVLNRMHSAALGDTCGLMLSMLGLMLLKGFCFSSFKMAMVVLLLWCTSPVSSHLIARLEVSTNETIGKQCEFYESLNRLEKEEEVEHS